MCKSTHYPQTAPATNIQDAGTEDEEERKKNKTNLQRGIKRQEKAQRSTEKEREKRLKRRVQKNPWIKTINKQQKTST